MVCNILCMCVLHKTMYAIVLYIDLWMCIKRCEDKLLLTKYPLFMSPFFLLFPFFFNMLF